MKEFKNNSGIFASADEAIRTIVPYYDTLVQRIRKEQDIENEMRTDGKKTLTLPTNSNVFVGLYELLAQLEKRIKF